MKTKLTREQWIDAVVALLGPAEGQFDPKQFAADMAPHHYDEPIADGLPPADPEEALHDEFQAGQ